MENIDQFYPQLSGITPEAKADLGKAIKTFTAKKGQFLLKKGTVCQHLYFINQGLCKTFFLKGDKPFIMRFFTEDAIFTVLDSFVNQLPSTYSIYALEPTTYTCLSSAALLSLCQKHHCIETFYRKLVSNASINMMKRISELLEDNASERYADFVKEHRELLQRISLGDLASYLGITQVSLSRLRAAR
ncbi:cyclic nucleotide-binding domain-containing protein [Pedobacter petrophilus]|uniref:Cyclic nucleotide-binding domain-containing protein n=1 Tax=Pedobacter petrophilus TaxID=1908241 RepID=A0A7K0FSA8_9SPHI|nr:Crp/Fnr family transcriptional regulator [Pedobacter petrophilus]MRX74498.1 cyclic nucleotide-binding domain-containing protein [Pedobacter petrophilus]